MKMRIVVHQIANELYIASCPNLEGCHVEAKSKEDAQSKIKMAIKAYIMSYKQRHEKIPYQSKE